MKQDNRFESHDDWIQNYINKKLSPEDAIEFETYFLDKPDIIEKLELDELMKTALVKNQADLSLVNGLNNAAISDSKALAANDCLWKPAYSHLLASAACVALIALLVLEPNQQALLNHSDVSPSIVYLESFRSVGQVSSITFSNDDQLTILSIDLPPDASGMFQIRFMNSNNELVLQDNLLANANGELVYLLQRQHLQGGEHALTISQSGNDILTLNIKVVKDP